MRRFTAGYGIQKPFDKQAGMNESIRITADGIVMVDNGSLSSSIQLTSDEPHLLPLTDARRAISLMKSMAGTYGFDPSKVGIMGFSAGGHLATAASVLVSEKANENPNFSALISPVTTLGPENQKWLEETLFHRPMTPDEQALIAT